MILNIFEKSYSKKVMSEIICEKIRETDKSQFCFNKNDDGKFCNDCDNLLKIGCGEKFYIRGVEKSDKEKYQYNFSFIIPVPEIPEIVKENKLIYRRNIFIDYIADPKIENETPNTYPNNTFNENYRQVFQQTGDIPSNKMEEVD